MPKAGGKWNTYEITAKGRQITVVLNGNKTAELHNGLFAEGPFTLQHGAGVIKFRKDCDQAIIAVKTPRVGAGSVILTCEREARAAPPRPRRNPT